MRYILIHYFCHIILFGIYVIIMSDRRRLYASNQLNLRSPLCDRTIRVIFWLVSPFGDIAVFSVNVHTWSLRLFPFTK